jgi:hypothetical protein
MRTLPIAYDPAVLATRIDSTRRSVHWSLVATGISVVAFVGVVLYMQIGRDGSVEPTWVMLRWLLAFSAAAGVLGLVARVFWLIRLRSGLKQIGDGLAMVLSASGIQTGQTHVPWDQVDRIQAVRGRLGHGYQLEIRRVDGSVFSLPLEGLDILPGSLDAATRAYSAGRHGVDLSIVDD